VAAAVNSCYRRGSIVRSKPKPRQAAGRVRRLLLGKGWHTLGSDSGVSEMTLSKTIHVRLAKHWVVASDRMCRLVLEVLPKQQPKRKASR
jgi:hypothetical protein